MIKPIPKRLLPNSCTYRQYLGNKGEGDEWDNPVSLNFIKIGQKLQFTVNSNGREIVGNAKLFYDCVNSNGLTEVPKLNDIIIFDGREYKVFDTEILRATSITPHHYEVILK